MKRSTLMLSTGIALFACSPAFGQNTDGTHSTASIPDFSGLWAHPNFPGFEPPATGPGPVVNKSRFRDGPNKGTSDFREFVGDYANPILQPHAAEVVKKHGEISLRGETYPTPSNQCWPEPLPYIFWNTGMQMLQQPHQITILYDWQHEVRHVRMNEPHHAHLTPSWYGDSVGHYEGATLVIDTVGIKVGPFAMIDMYGTPYSPALHVIERYRLLDYEAAREGLERNAKENANIGRAGSAGDAPLRIDPDYRGKHLQLEFTVEDEGVFTMPWSATITYRPGFNWLGAAEWPEVVCEENILFSAGKDEAVPHANSPDF